jgi:hypothetical protein
MNYVESMVVLPEKRDRKQHVLAGSVLGTVTANLLVAGVGFSDPSSALDWALVSAIWVFVLGGAVVGGLWGAAEPRAAQFSSPGLTAGFVGRIVGGFATGVLVGSLAVGL